VQDAAEDKTYEPRARVLYLSYDGMCDPLGGSQVLPYLFGLARRGHRISLISFEKPERSVAERDAVRRSCEAAGIEWYPLPYHKRPPVLSSAYDVWRMSQLAMRLHKDRPFDIVHCRSYIPALVGLRLKRRCGVRFLFDMRGFWADERVEGGQWNVANPLFRAIYRHFKRRESEFLAGADHVVSLTEAGKDIILGWRKDPNAGPPISIIPCCVDFEAFPPVTAAGRASARAELRIGTRTRVAAYLGSIGSWYMAAEMMDLFRVQLERVPDSLFLIISREPRDEILALAEARDVPSERLIVRSASRDEVPRLIAAADYGLFFIKAVFSKKSSSPTKMGELLALELPIVTNGSVGDVDRIMTETGAGVVVTAFNDDAYREALEQLDSLDPDMEQWRSATRRWLDLDRAVERYDAIYAALCAAGVSR